MSPGKAHHDSYARVTMPASESEYAGHDGGSSSSSGATGFQVVRTQDASTNESSLLRQARWSSVITAASFFIAAVFASAALAMAASRQSGTASHLRHEHAQVKNNVFVPVTSAPSYLTTSLSREVGQAFGTNYIGSEGSTSAVTGSGPTASPELGYYSETIASSTGIGGVHGIFPKNSGYSSDELSHSQLQVQDTNVEGPVGGAYAEPFMANDPVTGMGVASGEHAYHGLVTAGWSRNEATDSWYSTATATTTVIPNSLFCFALMMPHGYEKDLIMHLLMKGESIFACDAYSIFSETKTRISPESRVPIYAEAMGSMKSDYGGPFHLALNTDVFVRAWEKVFLQGKFLMYGWTVKVDPDCVFLPNLLSQQLQHADPENDVYLNNCDQGLHGPIEVISLGGMRRFAAGMDDCRADQKIKDERSTAGEDVFLRHCLDFLKINRVDNFKLLSEQVCFWEDPVHKGCVSGKVAFHPFKDVESYFHCLSQAKETTTAATIVSTLQQ